MSVKPNKISCKKKEWYVHDYENVHSQERTTSTADGVKKHHNQSFLHISAASGHKVVGSWHTDLYS